MPPPPAQVPPSAMAAAPAAAPPPGSWLAPSTPPPFLAANGPVYLPNVQAILAPLLSPLIAPPPGRLTLSNFTFDSARIQAVITSYPDCAVRPDSVTSDFVLPLNATRVIPTPPGADVCWRRELPLTPPEGIAQSWMPAVPIWAEWNRAFTASGRTIDARL